MCGNAREWTSSWYNPYPGHRFADARLIGHQFKVIRGGSYRQNQDSARADARDYGGFPELREDRSAGFRLVISIVPRL
jgi:formylglycine-generating enzyme required for sulfatase activity